MLDPKLLGGEFAVPVFVIQGAEDFITPTSLAKTYLNSLHSLRKAFATIDGAGHFAVFTKQHVFLKELRARVLPPIRWLLSVWLSQLDAPAAQVWPVLHGASWPDFLPIRE